MKLGESYKGIKEDSVLAGSKHLPAGADTFKMMKCSICNTNKSTEYRYRDGVWKCKHCSARDVSGIYFKEMGVENPGDPKGSTAHVRDIKARRLDPVTQKMFYYKPPKTYFFPKG